MSKAEKVVYCAMLLAATFGALLFLATPFALPYAVNLSPWLKPKTAKGTIILILANVIFWPIGVVMGGFLVLWYTIGFVAAVVIPGPKEKVVKYCEGIFEAACGIYTILA